MARLTGVVLVLVIFAAACSGESGGGGDGLVSSSLASLPRISDGDDIQILIADFDAASELLDADPGRLEDRLIDLVAPRPVDVGGLGFQLAAPRLMLDSFVLALDDFPATVGFEFDDIERTVETNAMADRVSVIFGPAGWGGQAEPHEGDVLTFTQGEDGEIDPNGRHNLDILGRPLRVADVDRQLIAGFSTPVLQGWLDGSGERLSEDEQLMALANALDAHDVISANLVVGDFALPESVESSVDPSQPFISEQFAALGVGNAHRDGQAVSVVAYYFETNDAAEAAMASVEEAWTTARLRGGSRLISDFAELETIEQNGTVVTVVLLIPDDAVDPSFEMISVRDVPMAYLR